MLARFVPEFWDRQVNPEWAQVASQRDLAAAIIACVARGWESKSVEEQQAQAVSDPSPRVPPLTAAQIASWRQKQGLLLSRQHVLQQLECAQNPRHRELLQRALADLDTQLAQLV